jgi:hypothetical protein
MSHQLRPDLASTTILLLLMASLAHAGPLVSIDTHDAFFEHVRGLCGQAFEGRVTEGNASDTDFAEQRLVMHIRQCGDHVIEIPFHVGEDRSRTWVLTRTGSGLQLKHDHRHEDGSDDASTMYGGHTVDAGWPTAQAFPADQYSRELFVAQGIPQSAGNTWHMYIYPETFTYRLTREGREFRVDFDLTRPVPTPPAPWGHE